MLGKKRCKGDGQQSMNPHMIFLLYLLAAISGVIAFAYYFLAFLRNFFSAIRSYLFFLASYSLMIFSSTVMVYVGINITPTLPASVLEVGVIIGACSMAYTYPAFIHQINHRLFPRFWKFTFCIAAWSAMALVPLSLCTAKTKNAALPLALSLFFFGISFIYVLFILIRNRAFFPPKCPSQYRIVIVGFAIFCIGSAVAEPLWLSDVSFNHGYVLSMPFIYLLWNILSYFLVAKSLVEPDLVFSVDEALSVKYSLTDREKLIAAYILKGKFNKEIAGELNISPHTVKNHIYNLFKKFGVQSRIEFLHKLQKV
jgi:DNA-binding CsgD family transcriptional regulator